MLVFILFRKSINKFYLIYFLNYKFIIYLSSSFYFNEYMFKLLINIEIILIVYVNRILKIKS